VAAFDPHAVGGPEYTRFVSPQAQLLNQGPDDRDC